MKFKRLINKSKETRRKYEYYLSLGYSEHAAKVLSVVTYGDEKLVFLVKQLGRKNVLEELYAWLHYTHSDEELFYWRTYTGLEVDAVIGDARVAIEIK